MLIEIRAAAAQGVRLTGKGNKERSDGNVLYATCVLVIQVNTFVKINENLCISLYVNLGLSIHMRTHTYQQ